MKEKISGEISSGINKGKEYTSGMVKNALDITQSIAKGLLGEKRWEWHRGEWERRPVKPGIREILKMIRR